MKKVNENYISAFGHLINIKDILLLDSGWIPDYSDYVEWCEDNECKPAGKDSPDYWDYVTRERDTLLENFWAELKYAKQFNRYGEKYMVTGHHQLWWGCPTIVPKVFNTLNDAMEEIVSGDIQDIRLTLMKDGSIEVQACHHDGTNVYYVHRLNKKGLQGVAAAENRWEDPEPKDWWFRRFYIDEIEF